MASQSSAQASISRAPAPVRAMAYIAGSLFPRLVGHAIGRRMLRPRRLAGRRNRDFLAEAQTELIQRSAGPVHIHKLGDGPAVLLVHGWEGDVSDFSTIAPSIADAGLAVIAMEAPAHGASNLKETDVHDFADAIAAVVRKIGAPVATFAHSLGAAAVLRGVSHHGLPLGRLVLLAPGGELAADIQGFGTSLGLPERCLGNIRSFMQDRYQLDIGECSSTRMALQISSPTLVVHDRNDRVIPVCRGRELANAISGSQYLETQGLGHRRVLQDEAVVAACLDFIRIADEPNGQRHTQTPA